MARSSVELLWPKPPLPRRVKPVLRLCRGQTRLSTNDGPPLTTNHSPGHSRLTPCPCTLAHHQTGPLPPKAVTFTLSRAKPGLPCHCFPPQGLQPPSPSGSNPFCGHCRGQTRTSNPPTRPRLLCLPEEPAWSPTPAKSPSALALLPLDFGRVRPVTQPCASDPCLAAALPRLGCPRVRLAGPESELASSRLWRFSTYALRPSEPN